MKSSTILIYFSLEGATKYISEKVSEKLGCELLEITYKSNRTFKGFLKYFIYGFQASTKRKPPINYKPTNLSDYDTIIIGSPVWGGNFSPPIRTFFSLNPVKDKNISLFFSCGLSAENAIKKLKSFLGQNNYIAEESFKDPLNDKSEALQKKIANFMQRVR